MAHSVDVFHSESYSTDVSELLAAILFAALGLAMYQFSANTLRGGIDVMRFRAMMTSIGALTVLGMLVGDRAGETWIVETEDWAHPILAMVMRSVTCVIFGSLAMICVRSERRS